MSKLDKYIKPLHDQIGDYLYDPEPVYEPLLERMDKGKVTYLYELLSELKEQIVIDELKAEKQEWPDNPVEGGRIG